MVHIVHIHRQSDGRVIVSERQTKGSETGIIDLSCMHELVSDDLVQPLDHLAQSNDLV